MEDALEDLKEVMQADAVVEVLANVEQVEQLRDVRLVLDRVGKLLPANRTL